MSSRATSPKFRARYILIPSVASLGLAGYLLSHPPSPNTKLALSYPEDPLSLLDPDVLSDTPLHLQRASATALLQSYIVYLTSSFPALVDVAPSLFHHIESVRDNVPLLGRGFWYIALGSMRHTFFAKFAGGESSQECFPLMTNLLESGCGTLLCYSAEAEVAAASDNGGTLQEKFVDAIELAIQDAAKFPAYSPPTNSARSQTLLKPTWVAIKLTGLIKDPLVLERATSTLESSSSYQRGNYKAGILFPDSPLLSDTDQKTLKDLHSALRRLCSLAKAGSVRIDLDAEQTVFQPAIDHYYRVLSTEFNKLEKSGLNAPIIYNTFQCYLKSTPERIKKSLAEAKANNLSFGAKLVRGAYVDWERAEAKSKSREDPIWSTKPETDACFDSCAHLMTEEIAEDVKKNGDNPQVGVMYASHNISSIRRVLEEMRRRKLVWNDQAQGKLVIEDKMRTRVVFGQLLGMADNLTAALLALFAPPHVAPTSWAQHDAPLPVILKYVPFGTIDQCLPYLIRRAQENKAVLQGTGSDGKKPSGVRQERIMVGREIRRRMRLDFG